MKNFSKLLCTLAVMLNISCSESPAPVNEFVTVENGQFIKNGKSYYYVGTNFWYGPILGSQGEGGDRERLHRELDSLQKIGVTNLRVLVGAEGNVGTKSKISPVLQPKPGEYNGELLDGLDYFMAEIGKRDMNAVLYLANAWEWSGGYLRYLKWAGELSEDVVLTASSWTDYRAKSSKFVQSEKAQELLNNHIKFILGRTNKYTGEKYTEDPAIFSWQLCNEPRAFSDESKEPLLKWIDKTSTLIRSLDPNHMISTGSEGKMGTENDMDLCRRIHDCKNISYINAHMWAFNWSWVDKTDLEGSIDKALVTCNDYIDEHITLAEELNKPLVFEEFGLPRDKFEISKNSTTICRDKLYKTVFDKIVKSHSENGKFAGCNFWAWGGEAEQIPGKAIWEAGMPYCGDPAQEAQGLNSVYITDASTIAIINETANTLK